MPATAVVDSIERAVYTVARSILSGESGTSKRQPSLTSTWKQDKAFDTPFRRAAMPIRYTSRSWTASCVLQRLRRTFCSLHPSSRVRQVLKDNTTSRDFNDQSQARAETRDNAAPLRQA